MAPGITEVLDKSESKIFIKICTFQFHNISKRSSQFFKSPCFNYANTSWHLRLYAGTMLDGYLSLYLHKDSIHPYRISFKFSLLDVDDKLINTKTMYNAILYDNEGIPNFIKLSECKSLLTPSDSLKINIKLRLGHQGVVPEIVGKLHQHDGMNRKKVEWHIPHFLPLFKARTRFNPFFCSPSFSVGNASCHLQLCPGTIFNGYLSVFLCNESRHKCVMLVSFSMKDAAGTLIRSIKRCRILLKESWGLQDFARMDCFDHFVPSDKLTVVCDVASYEDVFVPKEATNLKDGPFEQTTFTETEALTQNFKDLFDSKEGWDTILQVKRNKFKVHRAVLIARSSVFAAMFQHDTKEKQTGIVTIPDCDPTAFKKFLEFLYCGKLEDVSFRDVFYLYNVSDKYDVRQVKKFCSNYLRHSFEIENFCDVVSLANLYEDTSLLSAAQQFFNKNVAEILVTKDWKALLKKNLDLANRFLIEMTKK